MDVEDVGVERSQQSFRPRIDGGVERHSERSGPKNSISLPVLLPGQIPSIPGGHDGNFVALAGKLAREPADMTLHSTRVRVKERTHLDDTHNVHPARAVSLTCAKTEEIETTDRAYRARRQLRKGIETPRRSGLRFADGFAADRRNRERRLRLSAL